jgi:uncharacterized membrane protein YsdA (DUF1294 family)/cold shock CspA family protein
MRKEGTIVRWDDVKGFGFIRSGSIAQDVFVHVRDYQAHATEAPRPGVRVTFEEIHVGGKGPRAVAVQPVSAGASSIRRAEVARRPARRTNVDVRRPGSPSSSGAWWALPLMAAYAAALGWFIWQGHLPWWVAGLSILLNLATFAAYLQDKAAAQRGRWRVKEDTLHFLSLAGGWGGAWFAQQAFRHKTVKASFRAAYFATVAAHCGGVFGLWWLARPH